MYIVQSDVKFLALKFSSVWSEVVGFSKSKGGKVIAPLTRCEGVALVRRNPYEQVQLFRGMAPCCGVYAAFDKPSSFLSYYILLCE